MKYVPSTELQPAIAISNPARTGAARRAQENQSKHLYRRSWAFDIGIWLDLRYRRFFDIDLWIWASISKDIERYRRFFDMDIWIWASISKNLRYRILPISKKKLRYRRIFDIWCFDIEVPTFDIEVFSFLCASISKHADFDIEVHTFDIEVTYRTRYRS